MKKLILLLALLLTACSSNADIARVYVPDVLDFTNSGERGPGPQDMEPDLFGRYWGNGYSLHSHLGGSKLYDLELGDILYVEYTNKSTRRAVLVTELWYYYTNDEHTEYSLCDDCPIVDLGDILKENLFNQYDFVLVTCLHDTEGITVYGFNFIH